MTARSVILTTLLGYHPPELPAGVLIRVGALFGIAEKAVRVALHRMVADGDVVSDAGRYRLNRRLVERQARQDEAGSPRTKAWRGAWEMAVVTAPPRPLADRVALRKNMDSLRLARTPGRGLDAACESRAPACRARPANSAPSSRAGYAIRSRKHWSGHCGTSTPGRRRAAGSGALSVSPVAWPKTFSP